MKNLLLLLLFLPLCMACKKESIGEPLLQNHFIEFVDASGTSLFKSGAISTSEFRLISGDFTLTWEDILAEKKRSATSIYESLRYTYADTLESMLTNDNLFLEVSQGNLGGFGPLERVYLINGETSTFTYSLKEGFFQNGKKLKVTTEVIDEHNIYLHHVVLEEY